MNEKSSAGPESPLRVGYVLKMFPRLSETFILNELLELEAQGVEISIFSLMHPADGRFHGRLGGLRAAARYVPRDKPEAYWSQIRSGLAETAPPLPTWDEAARWLQRFEIPKDLDLLLRAVCIAAEVRAQGIQHLHAHFATIATRVAALVSMLTGVPFSFTSHAKDIFRETVDRELYADLTHRCAFNITVSDYNRSFLLEHTPGIAADKVVRLYNGIDLDFFRPEERTTPDPDHLVSVGRLVPKKGFDHLLRALRICKERGKTFRTTIVGDGEDREALLGLRRELDLEGDVTFAGALSQEEVLALCRDAGLMVLACVPDEIGNKDALPTTLLEALALDLPVVSTTLTGVPEIVGDEAGMVVPPGDDGALAEALMMVSRRVREGAIPAGVARARAERLFDLRQNVARLHQRFAASAGGTTP